MTSQLQFNVESNFTKGLITEATGLNFPENAVTYTDNCEYTLIGEVVRRLGINEEVNGSIAVSASRANSAMSTYVWNNPGGNGNYKFLVKQIGSQLYFYDVSASTDAHPLSTHPLPSGVDLTINVVAGETFDLTSECQYADGNGYLFVYHPSCNPSYCTYTLSNNTVANNPISIQIRDFVGMPDGLPVTTRPGTLSAEHQYNLQNQGWISGNPWQAASNTAYGGGAGEVTWHIGDVDGPATGQQVIIYGSQDQYGLGFYAQAAGTILAYAGGNLTVQVTSYYTNASLGTVFYYWQFSPTSLGYLNTWNSTQGNWPSNADVWWYYKDDTGVFNPSTTIANITLSTGNAPQGHYIMDAFNQDRSALSAVQGLNVVSTNKRPTTGTWFAGRVWYTGVNASQPSTSDTDFYTWTSNIYFSNIVETTSDFGNCYQTNDPTSENLFDEIATDGGVITIQETGTIHKLFPIANGLLVFANNGVWFITGSSGIGFAPNDYTITKISSVKVLSPQSFVDVLGMPVFWNEEAIYQVTQSGQGGGLVVTPITVGTINTFFTEIPLASKKYARGDYDPINYVIQWVYKTEQETSVTDRYNYDSILNYNTYNKAFFPYSISQDGIHSVNGLVYINYPYVDTQTPEPSFKMPMSIVNAGVYSYGFAEEYDDNYLDWGSTDYTSKFITGYKLHGQASRFFQAPYCHVYSRNLGYMAYYLQALWDYSNSFNSNRWSTPQFCELNETYKDVLFRRHRLRGRGMVLQLMFTSVPGKPFDFMGWTLFENSNAGV